MQHPRLDRIAIINGGEPALRLIAAARELGIELGYDVHTIAIHTEADAGATFVREADEAFCLGAATESNVFDFGRLEQALCATRADAAWVGWGLAPEHAQFADLCQRLGIVVIGPPGDVIRRLADRVGTRHAAEQAGVAVVPWSGAAVETLAQAQQHADRLGYPVAIETAARTVGSGLWRVGSSGELTAMFERARSAARSAVGIGTVVVERVVPSARRLEVQIVADDHGTVWSLGVRDSTIRRSGAGSVLEETPSPALTPEQDGELQRAAVAVARALGYRNIGTVEFLYDRRKERFLLLGLTAGLQIGHPLTELTTGVDLAKLQLQVAAGARLVGDPPAVSGHALEVELRAEDPERGFAAVPGVVERFRLPMGPGVRIDVGVHEGDEVQAESDATVARVAVSGRTRPEALARLQRVLAHGAVVVRGGPTNKSFLSEVLQRTEVQQGTADTLWLDRLITAGEHLPERGAEVALLQAAIEAYEAELAVEKATFYASAARGRPEVAAQVGRTVELTCRGQSYAFQVRRVDPHRYQVEVDGTCLRVAITQIGWAERRLSCGGQRHRVISAVQGATHVVEVDGASHRIAREGGGVVRAPVPAVVAALFVRPGDEVAVGDRLAVLEAMKTETVLVASFGGCVREILVATNVQVGSGTPLMLIEPPPEPAGSIPAARANFAKLAAAIDGKRAEAGEHACSHLQELRCSLLGFDADTAALKRFVSQHDMLCPEDSASDSNLRGLEDELLDIFVDISSLFRRQRSAADELEGARWSTQEYLFTYLRDFGSRGEGLPQGFVERLRRAVAHYGVQSLEPSAELEDSLFRVYRSRQQIEEQLPPILSILQRRVQHVDELRPIASARFRSVIDRLITQSQSRFPTLNDLAREVRYRYFDQPLLDQALKSAHQSAEQHLAELLHRPDAEDRAKRIQALVDCAHPVQRLLIARIPAGGLAARRVMIEVLTRRFYRIRSLERLRLRDRGDSCVALAEYEREGKRVHLAATYAEESQLLEAAQGLHPLLAEVPAADDVVLDFYVRRSGPLGEAEQLQAGLQAMLEQVGFERPIRRIVVSVSGSEGGWGSGHLQYFTFRPCDSGFREEKLYRGLHPMIGKRLHLWRLSGFEIERMPSAEDIFLYRAVGRENPRDERLIALAEVWDLTPVRNSAGRMVRLPELERTLMETLASIRHLQAARAPRQRLQWNRVQLFLWPPFDFTTDEFEGLSRRLAPATEGLGLEAVVLRARRVDRESGQLRDTMIDVRNAGGRGLEATPGGKGVEVTYRDPPTRPMRPLTEYEQKVVALRRRGMMYPYELIAMLTPPRDGGRADFPPGEFEEHDLDPQNRLVPVHRPPGRNSANIVVGVIRNFTTKHPEGMTRVSLLSDASRGMGSLAEPECRRINAALDLAEQMNVPLEWFAVSAGAKISMDSGVENMDWIALVLRRLIDYTQAGREVNVVVCGVTVGAQPYWNAEATMLMHTRGILVMTADASMVLTGKRALDYSGGVSAEDNLGIGGYAHIMGPNGQAQYFASDLRQACHTLLRYYDHTYVTPGERFPRRAATTDPVDRDIRSYAHGPVDDDGFATVGDVFSDETNPGRKKPFDIRRIMAACVDQDRDPLERWYGMRDAETAVVWDASLGGYSVCLIGLESRPLPRLGFVPADGPLRWTPGTLFPLSSKKVARAINAANGNRPLVILANLSGFDGSPESMRNLQLEYGAEIGRAVVNFKGPIVFCVVSRYHGGAFVVFSNKLNDRMEVAALEGAHASVIGGAPAAAVVFAREVKKRTEVDPRVQVIKQRLETAAGSHKPRLRAELSEVSKQVHSEKLGQVAEEFDSVHSVHRAREMGSVHEIIPPQRLRPWLIEALERGMRREIGESPAP